MKEKIKGRIVIIFYVAIVFFIVLICMSTKNDMDRNKLFSGTIMNGLRSVIRLNDQEQMVKQFLSATASYDIDPSRFLVRTMNTSSTENRLWVGFDFSKLEDPYLIGYCFETMRDVPEYVSGTVTPEAAPQFFDIKFDHRKHKVVWISSKD